MRRRRSGQSPGTGGAAVSTRPFAGVDARLSRYSYLVSLLPRKIVRDLDLDFRVRGRTVSSYTPVERAGRPTGLLVGGGERRTREAFARLTGGEREYESWQRFYGMTGRLAEKVFPTLTEPLPTRDELRRRDRERFAMPRFDDITGERGDVRNRRKLVAHRTQTLSIACGENEIPSARDEPACEREPESA